ncbi:MAG TPA: ectoine/hydroxyectoine ABC transporter permease subunit EhuD [Bradyrhizobium sp.]|nr:ectoine/hydroxyectoine ABC transporter permease subunit EhuD [Bradyrhizobium sp.]
MSSFHWDWGFAWAILPELLQGLVVTVVATLLGSMVAFALGMVWAFVRVLRISLLTPSVSFFVEFIRGTPLLIQLYFLYYVLPTWGLTISALPTGIFGLGLFYSAYAAEIFRAGIEDLPAGQWEAALTLGLPVRRVWLGIILPQAIRSVVPILGNVIISMFKQSSLLSTITVFELLAAGLNIGSVNYRYVEPLTLVGAFYFAISFLSARIVRSLEAKHAFGD